MSDRVRDEGFDDWLDALEDGDAYYLACPDDHGSLPPRLVCPVCGSSSLETRPLPGTGTVDTYTITHVPTPSFEADAPYVTAIAEFGPVRLTGQLQVDDVDDAATGITVAAAVVTSETTGDRLVGFVPE